MTISARKSWTQKQGTRSTCKRGRKARMRRARLHSNRQRRVAVAWLGGPTELVEQECETPAAPHSRHCVASS